MLNLETSQVSIRVESAELVKPYIPPSLIRLIQNWWLDAVWHFMSEELINDADSDPLAVQKYQTLVSKVIDQPRTVDS